MIILDYQDRRPLYEQIIEKLKELIFCGAMEEHTQLPSVRSLAMELSINPNTIQRAYAELERDQIIYSIKGRGSFVAPTQTVKDKKEAEFEENLFQLVRTARRIGIDLETLLQKVGDYYDEKEKDK